MHRGRNSCTKKRKLSKRKLNENRGKFINFAEIGGIKNFLEVGGYAICIIGLGGWSLLLIHNIVAYASSVRLYHVPKTSLRNPIKVIGPGLCYIKLNLDHNGRRIYTE